MKRRRSGFILTAMAVCTAVVMACAGLAIDAGYLQLIKTQMQTAADAAALGGAQEIKANGSANAVTAARNDAAARITPAASQPTRGQPPHDPPGRAVVSPRTR